MQGLVAAALQRLAALDLAEKERTAQHLRGRRQQRRQAAGSLHCRIQIDEGVAPAGAARGGPLIQGPHAGIEGGSQRIAPRRGDDAPQQEIAIAVEDGSLFRVQRIDFGGRHAKAHAAPYNLNVLYARASRARPRARDSFKVEPGNRKRKARDRCVAGDSAGSTSSVMVEIYWCFARRAKRMTDRAASADGATLAADGTLQR
ncbi:hypothetical protein [Bradyrhizobium sp. NAS80.1]|uniref:hypothetical protein n=1 Tax=Bradyrhizobium sp. NAS80.1 TaxID=1680159 RepID=UPI001FD9C681|nr:hypothetical protein [Bradyrhizobium sp. NAS80.1]